MKLHAFSPRVEDMLFLYTLRLSLSLSGQPSPHLIFFCDGRLLNNLGVAETLQKLPAMPSWNREEKNIVLEKNKSAG